MLSYARLTGRREGKNRREGNWVRVRTNFVFYLLYVFCFFCNKVVRDWRFQNGTVRDSGGERMRKEERREEGSEGRERRGWEGEIMRSKQYNE